MNTYGIRDAKKYLSDCVRKAQAGVTTTITYRRKPAATIGPLPSTTLASAELTRPAGAAAVRSDAESFRRAIFGAPFPLDLEF